MPVTTTGIAYPLGINFERSFPSGPVLPTMVFPWFARWIVPTGIYATIVDLTAFLTTSAVVKNRTVLQNFSTDFATQISYGYSMPETFVASTAKTLRWATYVSNVFVSTAADTQVMPLIWLAPGSKIDVDISNFDVGDTLTIAWGQFNYYYWDGSGDASESTELLMPVSA